MDVTPSSEANGEPRRYRSSRTLRGGIVVIALFLGAVAFALWYRPAPDIDPVDDTARPVADRFVHELTVGDLDEAEALTTEGPSEGPYQSSVELMRTSIAEERLRQDGEPGIRQGHFVYPLAGTRSNAYSCGVLVLAMKIEDDEWRIDTVAYSGGGGGPAETKPEVCTTTYYEQEAKEVLP